MTAVQGALLSVVAWFIGRKYKKIDFSWPAAVLFTFYPPFVLHSHYVTVDIPLTLFVMVVLLFCLNYLSSNKRFWLVMACVFVSIATLENIGILSFGIVLATIGIRAFNNSEQKKVMDRALSPQNDWRMPSDCLGSDFSHCSHTRAAFRYCLEADPPGSPTHTSVRTGLG